MMPAIRHLSHPNRSEGAGIGKRKKAFDLSGVFLGLVLCHVSGLH